MSVHVYGTPDLCKTLSLSEAQPLPSRGLQFSGRAETNNYKPQESIMHLKRMKGYPKKSTKGQSHENTHPLK